MTRWPRALFAAAALAWFFLEIEGLLFFSLGIWLAVTNVDVIARPTWFRAPAMLALWLGLCGIKTWLAFSVESLSQPMALGMMALHRGGEVAGLLTAWYGLDGLANTAMRQRLFRWLAGFSFMIYALHVPMVNYMTEAALQLGAGIAHIELWTYLVVPLIVVAVTVTIGVALRSGARPVYSLLTGGRGL